jgi:3-phenylpropionate/trans-cinnamate dioxygenase ferredoxin subunit
MTPDEPGRYHTVARVGALAPGDTLAVEVEGTAIVLLRDGDQYRAAQRWCPHQRGDLADGVVSRGHLICPVHGWRFRTDTGQLDVSPDTCLATYAVRVVGDAIQIDPTPRRYAAGPVPRAHEGDPE